jgi:hypothetical protein
MVNRNWSFLSDIVYRHRSVSLNNENICCEISEDKIAVCEKTAGLRSGNFSDFNSACSNVLSPVKIFRSKISKGTFRGHNTRTKTEII